MNQLLWKWSLYFFVHWQKNISFHVIYTGPTSINQLSFKNISLLITSVCCWYFFFFLIYEMTPMIELPLKLSSYARLTVAP